MGFGIKLLTACEAAACQASRSLAKGLEMAGWQILCAVSLEAEPCVGACVTGQSLLSLHSTRLEGCQMLLQT